MNIPENLKYTTEHEWILLENDVATVGITDYAQDQLGDIVYLELPEAETELKAGDTFGVVESTKSVSDLYAPVSGKVLEANTALIDTPEQINEDAYQTGWMIKLRISHSEEINQLLDAEAYQKFCN